MEKSDLQDILEELQDRHREKIRNLVWLNQRNALAVESAGIGIWDWDLKKDELVWDRRMYEMYGVRESDFSGAYDAWLSGLHPDDRESSGLETELALKGEKEYNTVFRAVHPDGQVRYIQAHAVILKDPEGHPERMIGINLDITERKIAERALEESEERFRTAFESMIEGIQILGHEWEYLYINPSAEIHNRRPKEELLGRKYADCWPGVQETHVYKVIEACVVDRKASSLDNRFVFPDGSDGWFQLSIQPIPQGTLILSYDMTDKKKIQDELIESEAKFSRIFQASPDGIALFNFDGEDFAEVNDSYLQITGYTREELIGRTPMQINLLLDPGERRNRRHKLVAERTIENFEVGIRKKNGEIAHCIATSGLMTINGRQMILQVLRDVSGEYQVVRLEKLALELLTMMNEIDDRHRLITGFVDKIKEGLGIEAVAIRLKEGEDYPYYATTGFPEDFVEKERSLCSYKSDGTLRKDAQGDPLMECMCGNIIQGRVDPTKSFFTVGGSFASNNTTNLLATTSTRDRMARTRNRCNSYGYESVALVPIHSRNSIIGLLQLNDHRMDFFTDDMVRYFERYASKLGLALARNEAEEETRKLNAELELRVRKRTEELESANRELEAFAYSVSHDLRAPLRAIDGWSSVLMEDYSHQLNEQGLRYLNVVRDETIRMGTLIDDMLKLSRLSRSEMNFIRVNLSDIASEVAERLKRSDPERQVRITIDPGLEVMADRNLMEVLLTNLLDNAFKFTGKKDQGRIHFGSRTEADETVFFVSDNGAGFNKAYAHQLFGVFQRLHSTGEFPGTGIGLAIVQRIINKHSGRIWAEGETGNGATFSFVLPGTGKPD